MINTDNLANCSWKVLDIDELPVGTAFFITENLLLTALHVVSDFLEETFYIQNRRNEKIKVNVQDSCEQNDLALLIAIDYHSTNSVILCNETPVINAKWSSFGYPATSEGLLVGSKIEGSIFHIIDIVHTHDLVLKTPGASLTAKYSGFSGSGVVNTSGEITSILRYKDQNNLCSVSVKKAEVFFSRNNIFVKNDELNDFSSYVADAFQYTSDPFQGFGKAQAKIVAQNTSPQIIASTLVGKLMIPEYKGNLDDIISYLKGENSINKQLWQAWLEFLTYVQFLKGEYQDINAIYISLPNTEVSKLVPGVETKVFQDINLTLQFFFTEEKAYFSIAKEYLLEKSFADQLKHNHCHIFHSNNPMFSVQLINNEEKKKIVPNIASPTDAGLNIASTIDFGVLSFQELTSKVAGSKTLKEITENLTKTFTDAIS